MISGFIEHAMLKARARLGLGGNVVIWLAAAGLLALIAVVFLTIALYAWLASRYGPAVAALDVGLLYAVLAVAAAVTSSAMQRRNREQARQRMALAAAKAAEHWPLDPKLLAVGLEIGRAVGWRRVLPLALAGVGIIAAVSVGRNWQESATASQPQDD